MNGRGNVLNKMFIGVKVSLLIVLAIASLGLTLGVSTSADMGSASENLGSLFGITCDIGSYFIFGAISSTINMLLSTILLITYVETYRRTRAQFSLVLVLVALTLLCYSIVANPLVRTALGYGGSGLGPFFVLPDLFTFGTLVALLYLSLKY
jgi:hypothetical protein